MELYHLRHAHRIGKNPHISKEGLLYAQEVGKKLPSFDVVLSSVSIRAIETTIAMGFSITDTINFDFASPKEPSPDANLVYNTFKEYVIALSSSSYYKEFSANLVQLITNKIAQYSNAENILVISHGGVIECSTIGFLPNLDYTEWGSSVTHCNGVKLSFNNGICNTGEKFL